MKTIALRSSSALDKFNPAKTGIKVAKLDALAGFAKAIQDWPLLENAVDVKIEDQGHFVAWWRKRVTGLLP